MKWNSVIQENQWKRRKMKGNEGNEGNEPMEWSNERTKGIQENKQKESNESNESNEIIGIKINCQWEDQHEHGWLIHRKNDTYFSKSGAKSAALDSLVNPVTYNVFLGMVIYICCNLTVLESQRLQSIDGKCEKTWIYRYTKSTRLAHDLSGVYTGHPTLFSSHWGEHLRDE